MPRRWYIAPKIGSGTHSDPYRPKVAQHGSDWSAIVLPAKAWCLVLVNKASLAAIEADAEIDRLPALALDRTLADLTPAQRQALATRLGQLGVDTAGFDATTTVRQVLRRIAGTLLADSDPEGLDVGNEGP